MSISSIGSTSSYSFLDRMVMSAMNRSSKSQGAESSSADLAAKIIEREDANGDGKISADESRVDADRFGEIDTDGDGSITSEELQASVKAKENDRLSQGMTSMQSMGGMGGAQGAGGPQGPPPGPPPDATEIASSVMETTDSNGDGVLSADETELSSSQFNTLDTDGDGKVSAEELAAGIKARQSEMDQARASSTESKSTDTSSENSAFQTFFETLAQNNASTAYGDTNSWLYDALQSSSAQSFTTIA